ncbi:hypothetical protein CpipJ_CPIJ011770, partial [Culex quinquefasciatus]
YAVDASKAGLEASTRGRVRTTIVGYGFASGCFYRTEHCAKLSWKEAKGAAAAVLVEEQEINHRQLVRRSQADAKQSVQHSRTYTLERVY